MRKKVGEKVCDWVSYVHGITIQNFRETHFKVYNGLRMRLLLKHKMMSKRKVCLTQVGPKIPMN